MLIVATLGLFLLPVGPAAQTTDPTLSDPQELNANHL